MVSAAERRAYQESSKLLSRHTGPHWSISIGPEYAKSDPDGIYNTEQINRPTRAAKLKRPKLETTSNSIIKNATNPVNGTLNKDKKNSYDVEKIVKHNNQPTRTDYTVRRYGQSNQDDTLETAPHSSHRFREAYWRGLRKGHQEHKSTERERRLSRK